MNEKYPDAPVDDTTIGAAEFGRVVLSLGSRIDSDDELLELLQRSVDCAHSVISGAEYCSVTVDFEKNTYTAVYTDGKTLEIDAQQYRANEGPCLHAARTGDIVVVNCDEGDARWPDFGSAARAEGVHSFLAAPVHANTDTFGAVNLYGADPAAFGDNKSVRAGRHRPGGSHFRVAPLS